MSTEYAQDNYENPEAREKLDEARQQLEREEQREQAEQASKSKTAREVVASEEQPGADDLPQPTTKTVAWRGKDLEWSEMGKSLAKIVKFEQNNQRAEMMDYIIELFAEKCRHPAADEEYWGQFDLMKSNEDDPEGLMGLFQRLTGASDIDPEEVEDVENLH